MGTSKGKIFAESAPATKTSRMGPSIGPPGSTASPLQGPSGATASMASLAPQAPVESPAVGNGRGPGEAAGLLSALDAGGQAAEMGTAVRARAAVEAQQSIGNARLQRMIS